MIGHNANSASCSSQTQDALRYILDALANLACQPRTELMAVVIEGANF
jgi:hypothetical protein